MLQQLKAAIRGNNNSAKDEATEAREQAALDRFERQAAEIRDGSKLIRFCELARHVQDQSLKEEFERVSRLFAHFLLHRAGYEDKQGYEIDRVVFVQNERLERQFHDCFDRFVRRREETSNARNLTSAQQFVMDEFSKYIGRVPGCEQVNLVLAWHSHNQENVFGNMVDGQFVPPAVDQTTIDGIENGKLTSLDVGWYGRGAYFSQVRCLRVFLCIRDFVGI
jgi:hypothetical protein